MKHKLGALDKYCIFSISIVLVYTIVEFIFSTITSTEHSSLTPCVYSFFGGEIVTLGLIKIFKLKEENNHEGET